VVAVLIIVLCFAWLGVAWRAATDVTMQVQIQSPDATGQLQTVTVPCTGRVRYDWTGRLHIIGGIGPEMKAKGELP